MLNWWLRYQPVLEALDAEPTGCSVLDVGSGWYGLSYYWPHSVVQTDLAFPPPRPTEERPGTPLYVQSTAERLPFADGSFDVAVSLDMMEHLPVEIREASVRELTRIARSLVVLAFPEGDAARMVDRALLRALRWTPGRTIPPWLDEHVAQIEYPDADLVLRSIPEGWVVASQHGVGNALLQATVVLAEELPVAHRVTRTIERRLRSRPTPRLMNSGRTYRQLYLLRRVG